LCNFFLFSAVSFLFLLVIFLVEQMSESVLMGISTFISATAFTLFCVGISAADYHGKPIQNTNWMYTHVPAEPSNGFDDMFSGGSPSQTLYFGIRAIAAVSLESTTITKLDDCGTSSTCNACHHAEVLLMPLISLCVIFSFLALVFSIIRIAVTGNKVLKFSGMVAATCATGFAIASFSAYAPCHRAAHKQFPNNANWGPGAICTISAWILMMLVWILQGWPSGDKSSDSEQVPTREIQLSNQA